MAAFHGISRGINRYIDYKIGRERNQIRLSMLYPCCIYAAIYAILKLFYMSYEYRHRGGLRQETRDDRALLGFELPGSAYGFRDAGAVPVSSDNGQAYEHVRNRINAERRGARSSARPPDGKPTPPDAAVPSRIK